MFKMTEDVIVTQEIKKSLDDPRAGGIVIFEGIVRDHNLGLPVSSLEYEAFTSMANLEGQKIIDKALSDFEIYGASAVHRVGHLKIGEIAISVVVTAAHRREAFVACEYIVDQIKRLVPIWKKEHYLSGKAEWVYCPHCKEYEPAFKPVIKKVSCCDHEHN